MLVQTSIVFPVNYNPVDAFIDSIATVAVDSNATVAAVIALQILQ